MATLSVLMPNYNHAKYIREALDAILCQSYQPIEVIVIDDASTDNSIAVIQEYVERYPIIRLIRNEKNMGVVHNLKMLSELARGEYICLPGADDKILPGFFEKSMHMLERFPQAGLCSTLSYVIDEEGKNRGLIRSAGIVSIKETFFSSEKVSAILLKYGSWIQGNSTIFRRDAFFEAGGYISGLRSFADGFIQQVIALKYGACFVPEPLAFWRHTETGYHMSSSRNLDTQIEIINTATKLMETTYKDLFPQVYVGSWRKKQLSLLNLNIWKASQQDTLAVLTRLKEPAGLLDKLLFILLKVFAKMEQAFVMLYFFVLYRYFPIQIIRRNVVSFFRRMMLRI